jgi:hypothetical protein
MIQNTTINEPHLVALNPFMYNILYSAHGKLTHTLVPFQDG